MAQYKYQTEGKTANRLKEKNNQTVEGEINLAPNVAYNINDIYDLHGLGSAFNGDYRFKKVTKRIEVTGMTVTATAVKL